MRLSPWLVALSLIVPTPALASSIKVVPKKEEAPKKEARPPPPAEDRGEAPAEVQREAQPAPSPTERRLREAPTPAARSQFRLKPLPLVGIGASIVLASVGTGLLIGAAGELDADQFTFDAEEQDDGSIDVEITDDFRDAQRAVILKGFGGTFMVSASAAVLTLSLVELFRRPPPARIR